jgi:hypothetical protein
MHGQYYISMLLIPFVVLAPYMSMPKWKDDFLPPNQHRVINPIWCVQVTLICSPLTNCVGPSRRYSAFQIVGAWANTGFSLVDQNLLPFQTAYPLLLFMVWLALAGNTGFVNPSVLYFLFHPDLLHSLYCTSSLRLFHRCGC